MAGAVYKPAELTVPQVKLKQPAPATLQFTFWLLVPVTVAENCCWPPGETKAIVGVTLTLIGDGDVTVTVAVPVAELEARDVAVTMTVGGAGAAAGAL